MDFLAIGAVNKYNQETLLAVPMDITRGLGGGGRRFYFMRCGVCNGNHVSVRQHVPHRRAAARTAHAKPMKEPAER